MLKVTIVLEEEGVLYSTSVVEEGVLKVTIV